LRICDPIAALGRHPSRPARHEESRPDCRAGRFQTLGLAFLCLQCRALRSGIGHLTYLMELYMNLDPQAFLRDLFTAAIDAAHPRQVLANYLPADRSGRAIVIGAGKAAAPMAEAIEAVWEGERSGLVVTLYGHGA